MSLRLRKQRGSLGGAPAVVLEAPELISNLVYWFRADTSCFTDLAATIQATDGQLVRAVTDKSGNSSTIFTVENDARRPTFVDSGINSQPDLEFDNSDDRFLLPGASAGEFEIERTDAFSIFLILTDTGNKVVYRKDSAGPGWRYEVNGQDMRARIVNTPGVNGITVATTTNKITGGGVFAVILTYSGSSTAAGFNIYISSTSAEILTALLDNATLTTVSAANLLVPDSIYNGGWPDWAFYDKELSASEVSDLMTYSGDRYGVTIS